MSSKPFIPVAIPNMAGRELEYLTQCVEDNFVSSVGPFVTRFEEEGAEAMGADHGAALASGTCALHLALRGVGVERDDLVIIPSLTFIATANAVSHAGATPWLLDIDTISWTLDPDLLERMLEQETEQQGDRLIHRESGKKVSAIVPVYTLGLPANMDRINDIAQKYRLPVVADGAAALGAKYKGRMLGGLADVTMVSFNGNKTVTAGGGGIVAGVDKELINTIRHLSAQAKTGPGYRHDQIGFNYRLTNLQAAVGCAQLENLNNFVEKKQTIGAAYNAAVEDMDTLSTFPAPEWAEGSCWLTGVIARDTKTALALKEHLAAEAIGTSDFWMPIHLQPPYEACPRSTMEVCEDVWDRIVILPCSTDLPQADRERVVESLRSFR